MIQKTEAPPQAAQLTPIEAPKVGQVLCVRAGAEHSMVHYMLNIAQKGSSYER